VEILSGVFEGRTTGTPIQLMIRNTDQRSKDYAEIAESFRPGHADITYWQKYGIRDYRGGGRSSARETAARVAAGGVARAALACAGPGPEITGYMVQMGPHGSTAPLRLGRDRPQPVLGARRPGRHGLGRLSRHPAQIRRFVGAMIEVVARGVPAGLGAPIYGKLDTDLAAAMMSINAVKASRSAKAWRRRR
jgi:chorismate synthase